MAATEQHCASCYVFALSSPAICARTHTYTFIVLSQSGLTIDLYCLFTELMILFLIPNLTFTVIFLHFQQHTYCLLSRLLKETHTYTFSLFLGPVGLIDSRVISWSLLAAGSVRVLNNSPPSTINIQSVAERSAECCGPFQRLNCQCVCVCVALKGFKSLLLSVKISHHPSSASHISLFFICSSVFFL